MELDPEVLRHERPPRLDPRPRLRVGAGERLAKGRVGEGDPVLDVRREVVRAGRRDDVDLERHPGCEGDRRAAEDRRVDPLVEMDLVARVQEDPEERIAEPPVDDRLEVAARDADPEGPVPLDDGGEVRPDQPVDVVADRLRELGGVLDDEPGPAVQRPPDPEADREPVAALDRAVARAEQAEGRPRPGREHHVAGERRAVPAQERDRLALRQPGPEALEEPPHAVRRLRRGPLEPRELVDVVDVAQPAGRVDQQVAAVLDEAVRPDEAAQRVDEERRRLEDRPIGVGLPAVDADPGARRERPRRRGSRRAAATGRAAGSAGSGPGRGSGASARGATPAIPQHSLPTRIAGSPSGPTIRIASSNRGSKPVRNEMEALCSRSAKRTNRS